MIFDWLNEIEKIFPNLGGGSEEEVNQGWADAMARILENQLPEDKVSDKRKTSVTIPADIVWIIQQLTKLQTISPRNNVTVIYNQSSLLFML